MSFLSLLFLYQQGKKKHHQGCTSFLTWAFCLHHPQSTSDLFWKFEGSHFSRFSRRQEVSRERDSTNFSCYSYKYLYIYLITIILKANSWRISEFSSYWVGDSVHLSPSIKPVGSSPQCHVLCAGSSDKPEMTQTFSCLLATSNIWR